jgi:hypothetical protein
MGAMALTTTKERKQRAISGERPYLMEGLRLRAFRELVIKMSFEDVAALFLAIDSHGYRQNENGKTLSIESALILKRLYGLSLDWLLAGDERAFDSVTAANLRSRVLQLQEETKEHDYR